MDNRDGDVRRRRWRSFTIQALRLYQDLTGTEILVIDHYACDATQRFVESVPDTRYLRATNVGTAVMQVPLIRNCRDTTGSPFTAGYSVIGKLSGEDTPSGWHSKPAGEEARRLFVA